MWGRHTQHLVQASTMPPQAYPPTYFQTPPPQPQPHPARRTPQLLPSQPVRQRASARPMSMAHAAMPDPLHAAAEGSIAQLTQELKKLTPDLAAGAGPEYAPGREDHSCARPHSMQVIEMCLSSEHNMRGSTEEVIDMLRTATKAALWQWQLMLKLQDESGTRRTQTCEAANSVEVASAIMLLNNVKKELATCTRDLQSKDNELEVVRELLRAAEEGHKMDMLHNARLQADLETEQRKHAETATKFARLSMQQIQHRARMDSETDVKEECSAAHTMEEQACDKSSEVESSDASVWKPAVAVQNAKVPRLLKAAVFSRGSLLSSGPSESNQTSKLVGDYFEAHSGYQDLSPRRPKRSLKMDVAQGVAQGQVPADIVAQSNVTEQIGQAPTISSDVCEDVRAGLNENGPIEEGAQKLHATQPVQPLSMDKTILPHAPMDPTVTRRKSPLKSEDGSSGMERVAMVLRDSVNSDSHSVVQGSRRGPDGMDANEATVETSDKLQAALAMVSGMSTFVESLSAPVAKRNVVSPRILSTSPVRFSPATYNNIRGELPTIPSMAFRCIDDVASNQGPIVERITMDEARKRGIPPSQIVKGSGLTAQHTPRDAPVDVPHLHDSSRNWESKPPLVRFEEFRV